MDGLATPQRAQPKVLSDIHPCIVGPLDGLGSDLMGLHKGFDLCPQVLIDTHHIQAGPHNGLSTDNMGPTEGIT